MLAAAGEPARKLGKSDGDVGPGHPVTAMREREVAFRDLEFLGCQLGSFADDLARASRQRAAVADERARSEAAGSDQRRPVGVAGLQPYGAGCDAQDIGDQLREHRLVPLAGPARQREEIERTVGVEANRDLFLADAAGRLDEHGAADSAQLAVAPSGAAAAFEPFPIGRRERLLEQARRIAAVVGRSGGSFVRERRLWDQILAPQRNAIDAAYCIVTIPLKVLEPIESDFSSACRAAIRGIDYGNAIKIAWQSRRFWEIDDQIYGGISWVKGPTALVWYPSERKALT